MDLEHVQTLQSFQYLTVVLWLQMIEDATYYVPIYLLGVSFVDFAR